MKTLPNVFLLLLLMFCCLGEGQQLMAQNSPLPTSYKAGIISRVAKELEDRYVFPAVATKAADHLRQQQEAGYFEQFSELEAFAAAVTESIFSVAKDKHLSVSLREQSAVAQEREEDPLSSWIKERMEERTFYRRYNANFKGVTKMDGNIGYLELRGFYGLAFGKEHADRAMAALATSDAIIIDLRNNSGGRGDMVEYLLSYFFDQPIIASKSRKRNGDQFSESINMTPRRLTGKNLPEVPVYILTSDITFSAAEGFTYPMQAYKRATVIGDTTKGGANPGDLIPLDDSLQVFISDVSVTHPLTGGSWEGVGIIPDVKTSKEEALEVALQHAREAAKKYQARQAKKAHNLLIALNETVENFDGSCNQKIIDAYLACKEADLIFEEWELNNLGYHLLGQEATKATAEAVLEANTVLYPHSANVFDSLGDALVENGKLEKALASYQKAVQLGESLKLDDLELFQQNLERVKQRLSEE
ncbi:MAG: S41 family peptidase [Bacteroidota bacterium]